MRRLVGLLFCSLALSVPATTATTAASFAAPDPEPEATAPACAAATTTTTTVAGGEAPATAIPAGSPPPSGGCWSDVQPYPFGVEGEAVNTSKCAPGALAGSPEVLRCYLTVTSMAFRAWNRGLAATSERGGGETPFAVWIFNGARWFPDPSPPPKGCSGHTIVWAGKLDYWLVGGPPGPFPEQKWADVCRFDGSNLQWEPLELPEATEARVTLPGTKIRKVGGITSAACFAWNDCWFFGTYGAVVHWDGQPAGQPPLTDASPEPTQSLLQGEYTAAVARENSAGEPFGAAVSATSEGGEAVAPLQTQAEGEEPPQLYSSIGGAFSPLAFAPATTAQPGDPYRTDLVAVALDSAEQGWVAGNPAGLRLREREGLEPPEADPAPSHREFASSTPQPSPIAPIASTGVPGECPGPPADRFTYTPFTNSTATAGSFLWSSIAAIPGSGEALVGGHMRRATAGSGPNEDAAVGEPVIARAGCDGTTSVTRFRVPDPTTPGQSAPGDRSGGVTALVANAPNDAWAATSRGKLKPEEFEPPHLYRFTNGEPPEAPEGNDEEERPLELKLDPPIIEVEPEPEPPPPPPPAVLTQTPKTTLPAALYDVKAKLHTTKRHGQIYLSLYLTFKLRRHVTIGAQALRKGRVVSTARPRHFTGRTGVLILSLDRKHWPTKVRFIS
jgi:hypothetical protein